MQQLGLDNPNLLERRKNFYIVPKMSTLRDLCLHVELLVTPFGLAKTFVKPKVSTIGLANYPNCIEAANSQSSIKYKCRMMTRYFDPIKQLIKLSGANSSRIQFVRANRINPALNCNNTTS